MTVFRTNSGADVMQVQSIGRRLHQGFSLIEVMIAVVVLAVGLLALVGLQTNLVRGGADAKARSRIAALVSSKMDEARAGGYYAIGASLDFPCAANNDVCQAQNEAAVSGLALAQGAVTTTGANDAEYKRLTVSASWTDSAGAARTLSMASVISPLSLDASNTLLNQQLSGDSSKSPIVRTDNPATAGVVPIAMGNGSSSAASNPTPELVGRSGNEDIVSTKFNVLTYVPSGASAVIQKRIETEVIKCSCQYGALDSGLPDMFKTAQWPAIWTGERYDVYSPSPVAVAPGQTLRSGPKSGAVQSDLCLECCRDHHDTSAVGVAKFDPERSGSTSKFELNRSVSLVAVNNTTNGSYANSCRIVRVDGFWRTAADLYSRQFGLLETASVAGVQAKTGLPTTTATTAYTSFVKRYLQQYNGTVATAPANAQTMFDATAGINDPAVVAIAAPSTIDYRYLHTRGLYVDYLESDARAKLVQVLADTGTRGRCPSGTDVADCVLPYLPFTSANLTEIATWAAVDATVLGVNSGNLLFTNPSLPSGGRTYGKKVGASSSAATARRSNSGVAINTALVSLAGVDTDDQAAVDTDSQAFEVGGTPGSSTGGEFLVQISGGGLNPGVFYTIGDSDSGECLNSELVKVCTTNSTLPAAGSVTLRNYSFETLIPTSRSVTATCEKPNGSFVSVTATIGVPTFRNYEVTTATIGVTGGTISDPVLNNKTTETTMIAFGSIPANSVVLVTLAEEAGSPTYATVQNCTTNGSGNTLVVNAATGWNKPWTQP